jgi:hypothetical protein
MMSFFMKRSNLLVLLSTDVMLLPFRFNTRLFVLLFLTFILFTCIGTWTHEMGYIAVAKMLGCTTHLGFGYMDYDRKPQPSAREQLLIIIGGPAQTMLTGTLGLILLLANKKKFMPDRILLPWQWLSIFLALFWLRQSMNMVMGIKGLLTGRTGRSDEPRIANMLHWPVASITTITGCIGLLILGFIMIRFIPPMQRWTFIFAGLAGGLAGFWLWLIKLGPLLMP